MAVGYTPMEKVQRYLKQRNLSWNKFKELADPPLNNNQEGQIKGWVDGKPVEANMPPAAAVAIATGLGWSLDWLLFEDDHPDVVLRADRGRPLTQEEQEVLKQARLHGQEDALKRLSLALPYGYAQVPQAPPATGGIPFKPPQAPPSRGRKRKGG
jgi:hypothetical protein